MIGQSKAVSDVYKNNPGPATEIRLHYFNSVSNDITRFVPLVPYLLFVSFTKNQQVSINALIYQILNFYPILQYGIVSNSYIDSNQPHRSA